MKETSFTADKTPVKAKPGLLGRGARFVKRVPKRWVKQAVTPWLGSLRAVATTERVAALTFDDGPHPEYTPRLLELLARHDAKATFFLVGAAAEAHPEVVRQIVEGGHALANHTFDHRSVPLLSRQERVEQLRRCAAVLAPFGGDNGLFRPPYGHQDRAARLDALRLGYEVVAWSEHAFDWLEHDSAFFVERLEDKLRPGSIFLLHDTLYRMENPALADRGAILTALDTFLAGQQAYRFLTVPELLKRGKPQRFLWFRPADPAWLQEVDPLGLGAAP